MRILVFQHIGIEHPAILRDFMAADGARALPAFNERARKLYDNFMAIVRAVGG